MAGFIQQRLDEAAASAALVSRSGVDLSRFALAHSHAGIALRAAAQPLWVVRQLYYDCAQDRPRIFDQGLAVFLLGGTEADAGRLSLILLAGAEGAPVREAASERPVGRAPAVDALQRECACVFHPLPELQSVGGRTAGHGLVGDHRR